MLPIKKLLFSSFVLLLSALALCPLAARAETVLFGANESPPCWSARHRDNGMCGQIVQAISKEMGLATTIGFFPLSRLIEDDSNNDLGNPVFYMANQDFAAIIPIAIYHVAYFYYAPNHKQKIILRNLNDLKGYRIGVLKGTLAERESFSKAGITFEESYSQESLFKKLKLGRIDLCVELELTGREVIKRIFPEEAGNFKNIVIPNSASPVAMMIDKRYPNAKALGRQYREGLRRIIKNGTYQKILDGQYGAGNTPPDWFDELYRFERLYNFDAMK